MRRTHVIAGLCVLLVLVCSGFFLTGVQRVREAAARVKCQGNLSYLSHATYNWFVHRGQITGTVPLPAVPPDRRLSWLVEILPYAEQGPLYERFDLALPAYDGRNRAVADRSLQMFECPMFPDSRRAKTTYVGIAGVGADAAELPAGHPRAGVFGYDRKTRFTPDGITDGVSTTLLIVETAHDPVPWAVGGPGTVRPFVPDQWPYIGDGRPFGGFHAEGFLRRSGLMNVAMADGSSRTVRGDIDPAVLEALATANGRKALPAEW
jgi:hypothetical protein